MAVPLVNGSNTTSTSTGSATSVTFAHTVGAGLTDSCLIVGFTGFGNGFPTVHTYAGVNMPQFNGDATQSYVSYYYLQAPSSGSNNVNLQWPSSDTYAIGAVTLTGVIQSGNPTEAVTQANTALNTTLSSSSVTLGVDRLVFHVTSINLTATGATEGGGQTPQINAQNTKGEWVLMGTKSQATAASVSMSTSWTTPAAAQMIEFAVIPVAAVGPANVKTWNGLAIASIKTVNGLAIASVKTINGLN